MRRWKQAVMLGLALGAFAGFGCGPSHPSRAQAGETCFGTPISCHDEAVESCCTASQCAYRVSDGKDFPCDGQDCGDAANDVNAYCQQ